MTLVSQIIAYSGVLNIVHGRIIVISPIDYHGRVRFTRVVLEKVETTCGYSRYTSFELSSLHAVLPSSKDVYLPLGLHSVYFQCLVTTFFFLEIPCIDDDPMVDL